MNPDAPAVGKWKVMVIPALQEASNLDMIDACIADEGPNETIFLGNYFDEVAGDHVGVESARRMARWLKRSVSQSRRIHLMGGRDLPYLFADGYTSLGARGGCNGKREAAVWEVLGPMAHLNFHLTWWEGPWLFTHAGLSAARLPDGLSAPHGVRRYLDGELRSAMRARREGRPHWVWDWTDESESAGGESGALRGEHGGLRAVRGVNQVFGGAGGDGARVGATTSINHAFDTTNRVEGWVSYLLLYPDSNTMRSVRLNEIEAITDHD
jgi:hypothetical protein